MEPHNKLMDFQNEEAQCTNDDESPTAEKCTDVTRALDNTGEQKSLEFKECNKMSWNNADDECLEEEDEEEEAKLPHKKKARRTNL